MLFDTYIVPEVLNILSVSANGIALITVLIINAIVLIKSTLAMKSGISEDANAFEEHTKILDVVKSCYICGK